MIGRFRDPVRLTDDPSASTKGVGVLIERVRREGPNDEQVAALFSRVEARITEIPLLATSSHLKEVTGSSKGPLLATTKAPALLKSGLLMLGGSAAIIAGGLWMATSQPVVATNPAANTAAAHTSISASVAQPIDTAVVAAKAPAPKVAAGRRPSVPADTQPSTTRVAAAVRPRVPETPTPVREASPPPKAATDSEADLLRAALDALPSTPRTALRLTEEHGRRYPDGMLTQEREVIAIEALMKLGHRDAARLRAQELLIKHPSTAHNARIEALLQSTPSPVDAGQPRRLSR